MYVMKKLLMFCFVAISLCYCAKKEDGISKDCYLVGFDPCSYATHQIGYVLISSNLQDTVITYNFPDSLFTIPPEYYANYVNTGYFPTEARYRYRTYFNCKVAVGKELIYLGCLAYLNQSEFLNATQVITLSASKHYY
jgi:hypothetical protein